MRIAIYSKATPAMASFIKCKYCDGAMEQVRSKNGGYYGCYNAKSKVCENKQLISRKQIEAIILNDLKEKFLTLENLKCIYENTGKTLNEKPISAALALKELLGTIGLESVPGEYVAENGTVIQRQSYYVAHTTIQTLALLHEASENLN